MRCQHQGAPPGRGDDTLQRMPNTVSILPIKLQAFLVSTLLLCPIVVTAEATPLPSGDVAEQKLISSLNLARQQQWQQASSAIDELCRTHANFQPALLLQQLITNKKLPGEQQLKPISKEQDEFNKQNVLAELHVRDLARNSKRNYEKLQPASILQIGAATRHIVLVDLSEMRLFVIKNSSGKLKTLVNYYAGIGKQGAGKQYRGDHRTPIGIYSIVEKLADKQVPELYGAGALPLNYPNAWDHRLLRTGSGIWIHGVPRNTYSRTPFSSRGCVTLSNDIYTALSNIVELRRTPVILSTSINWLSEHDWQQQNPYFSKHLHSWLKDWSSQNFSRYISHYSQNFANKLGDFESFKNYKQSINTAKKYIKVAADDIHIYRYPDENNIILTEFEQHYTSDSFSSTLYKSIYWQLEDDGIWRIIYEGPKQ